MKMVDRREGNTMLFALAILGIVAIFGVFAMTGMAGKALEIEDKEKLKVEKPIMVQCMELAHAEHTQCVEDVVNCIVNPDTKYWRYYIHGAYWHNKFGTELSHGCVNLSVGDSHWLFDWAEIDDWVYVWDSSGKTPTDPEMYGEGGA